jgi:gliding motility-associated-like protein
VVTVTDTLGCPKVVKDSVYITVVPHLNVDAGPPDTTIVEGQPLQLNASGALHYLWSPSTWLNNVNVHNPLGFPEGNIKYIVVGTDATGCMGTDSINITVYMLDPDMYVPTAFTPNGDGNNDVIRPILIGMKQLNYFTVYNRFGQLMFHTTEIDKGWNGIYAGKPQDPATFVWIAEGVTYKGQVKKQKGYVVLIR